MKIRLGFVSNSSSSSFVFYGAKIPTEKLHNFLIKKLGETKAEELIEERCSYEMTDELFPDGSFQIYQVEDDYYFGRDPFGIKDDETGKEFREGTENKAKECFGIKKCGVFNEVVYN